MHALFSFRKFAFHCHSREQFHYPRLIQSSSLQHAVSFFASSLVLPFLTCYQPPFFIPWSFTRPITPSWDRFGSNSRDLPTPREDLFALSPLSFESHLQSVLRRRVPCFLNNLSLLSFLPPKGISFRVFHCHGTKVNSFQGPFVLLSFWFYFVTRYV